MSFEPKIIAFCCNWCSYVGADTAGISRFEYPPNIRIIRVMCSGMIEPAYVLKCFEYGADGVLVTGCHIGECHYVTGNKKAEKRIEKTAKILETLGINTKRLRLEWISASEGTKLANTAKEFVEELKALGPIHPHDTHGTKPTDVSLEEYPRDRFLLSSLFGSIDTIVKKTKVYYCVECGKCSASCPVTRVNDAYSPRVIIEKTLEGIGLNGEIWSCITCAECTQHCPSTVRYPEFIRSFRVKAFSSGEMAKCSQAGALNIISKLMTSSIEQKRKSWIPKEARTGGNEFLYFVGCLPYFEYIFSDFNSSLEIAKSTLKLLNAANIEPKILNEERCCGHDLLWTGDVNTFEKLARLNLKAIEESGVSTVVTSCPECYRTLKIDYAEIKELKFEILHISELIEELVKENRINFKKTNKKLTYHDPCRLGRHLGVYDAPRNVIKEIGELIEMDRSKTESYCCGVSAWSTCDANSKEMQISRLKEAMETGADTLITACPKCQIHLRCAVHNKIPVEREED
ncbi:MAG TPA: hydrogenase iron-sulfur subunit, partial [Methanosarcinales archaeon]|nr:hydrogenase iron-sulfur subunit [Methanosarcinales archaeon]